MKQSRPRPAPRRPQRKTPAAATSPRVVYTQPPAMLGVVLGRGVNGWRVRLGDVERELPADPAVDEALLEEAALTGGRALVDTSAQPVLAGLLVTSRSVRISRTGVVDAEVNDFRVTSEKDILLRTRETFVQLRETEVELHGNRIVARARELAKILGRMIKLN